MDWCIHYDSGKKKLTLNRISSGKKRKKEQVDRGGRKGAGKGGGASFIKRFPSLGRQFF